MLHQGLGFCCRTLEPADDLKPGSDSEYVSSEGLSGSGDMSGLCEQEVLADETPALQAVLCADTKRLRLLEEERLTLVKITLTLENTKQGWRAGPVVKITDCFSRTHRFGSQHQEHSSQSFLTPVSKI